MSVHLSTLSCLPGNDIPRCIPLLMDCRSPYLAGQSAFAFAARPFNVTYVGDCPNTVPRSPAPQNTIHKRVLNPHLLDPNGDVVVRVDSVHGGDDSQHDSKNSPY